MHSNKDETIFPTHGRTTMVIGTSKYVGELTHQAEARKRLEIIGA